MKLVAIDVQGFHINSKFVPKEVSVKCSDQILHLLIKSPVPFEELSISDKKHVRFLEARHHGLSYSSGHICIEDIPSILEKYLVTADFIYVKGHQKVEFARDILNGQFLGKIVNVETCENPPKFELDFPMCLHHHFNDRKVMCSLRNVELLYGWLFNILPQ